jgi:hypothetical protein
MPIDFPPGLPALPHCEVPAAGPTNNFLPLASSTLTAPGNVRAQTGLRTQRVDTGGTGTYWTAGPDCSADKSCTVFSAKIAQAADLSPILGTAPCEAKSR